MVMNAARRSLDQFLYGAIGRARRECPIITDLECSRGGIEVERNYHAILEDERSARGRNGNVARASRGVQVNPDCSAVTFVDFASLVPANQAGMPGGVGEAVGIYRKTAGRN